MYPTLTSPVSSLPLPLPPPPPPPPPPTPFPRYRASSWNSTYQWIPSGGPNGSVAGIGDGKLNTEDPTIYRGRRGFHALFHSHPDLTHAWSEDGITWRWSNEVIGPVPQAGGDNERPRVSVDGNGDLSVLLVGQLVVADHDGSRTAAFVPNPRGERKEREHTQSEVEGGQA